MLKYDCKYLNIVLCFVQQWRFLWNHNNFET